YHITGTGVSYNWYWSTNYMVLQFKLTGTWKLIILLLSNSKTTYNHQLGVRPLAIILCHSIASSA
ncbi:hypothetical protein, partial [Prevotella sp.]|uniref:hypothetical protein n=1 Tax=Prevotella sp. TaxID=59823 RepID=UPI0027E28145